MIAANTIVGGRYRVVRVLGGGGMKQVYLAEDLRLAGRPCALAEMVDSFTSPDAQMQATAAFQREADMLAQLSNEHIPRVFDRFSEANHHYLVMEYIDGITLEDELRSHGGKLAPPRVVEIAVQILETLEYLHNLSPPVIYRDLKPSNVMITRDGHAKLIDFGIARHFQPLSNATMIGTQGYAPPEQYRGRVETRSDLYALGATMHHALSGRDPAAEAPFSFPPLRKLCPDIDPKLAAAVDQALAYDVINRIPDAAEFRRQLIEAANGSAAPAAATGSRPGLRGTNSNNSARPQLNLPLGGSPGRAPNQSGSMRPRQSSSAAASSSSAPTILSVNNQVICTSCGRPIPADSRFCSYCAADLNQAPPGGTHSSARPEDDTVLLRTPNAAHGASTQNSHPATARDLRGFRRELQRRGRRHFLLTLILIFLGAFLIVKLLLQSGSENTAPPSYDSGPPPAAPHAYGGAAEPPRSEAVPPPSAPDSSEPGLWRLGRMAALRRALDAEGFTAVQFRLDGDTLVLWGTVRTADDRGMVQMLCSTIGGVYSLQDHLTVSDPGGDD